MNMVAAYLRLIVFVFASGLCLPDGRRCAEQQRPAVYTLPSEACEIIASDLSGNAWGGRTNGAIYVCMEPGATGVLSAKCPVPLSNIRAAGSGSPKLVKFRVYYMDDDAAGADTQVYVTFAKKYITGSSVPIDLVCGPMDSNTSGNTNNRATTSTKICSAPYTFQAKTFYSMSVRRTVGPSELPRCAQFYGIDFP